MEKYRFLIVDDEESIRISLRFFLVNEGYEVKVASDATEAVELINQYEFCGAFLDRIFPGEMDGLELAKIIKTKQPKCQVVIISAYPTFESAKEGMKMGLMDYIVKPIKKEEVIKVAYEMITAYQASLDPETELSFVKSVLDMLPMPALVLRNDGLILHYNSPFSGFLPIKEIKHFDEIPYSELSWSIVKKRILNQPDFDMNVPFEAKIVDQQNNTKLVSVSISRCLFSANNELIFLFMHDISELKKKEDELQLARKFSSIGYLTTGLIHNFNNIMQIIIGNLSLMRRSEFDHSRAKEKLDRVLTLSQKASEIIFQLQEMVSSGKRSKVLNSLNNILCNTFNLIRNLTTKHIDLVLELPDNDKYSIIDKSEIEQVIINLVANSQDAILEKVADKKATEPLYGRIILKLEEKNPPLEVIKKWNAKDVLYNRITVEDDGIGIDPQDIDKIFEYKFTKKRVRKGSGIGLSWVKDIIISHEGAIEVESEVGKFTRFHVYLPAYFKEA